MRPSVPRARRAAKPGACRSVSFGPSARPDSGCRDVLRRTTCDRPRAEAPADRAHSDASIPRNRYLLPAARPPETGPASRPTPRSLTRCRTRSEDRPRTVPGKPGVSTRPKSAERTAGAVQPCVNRSGGASRKRSVRRSLKSVYEKMMTDKNFLCINNMLGHIQCTSYPHDYSQPQDRVVIPGEHPQYLVFMTGTECSRAENQGRDKKRFETRRRRDRLAARGNATTMIGGSRWRHCCGGCRDASLTLVRLVCRYADTGRRG